MNDDEPEDNPLASVDLHAWRVPEPAASAASLVARALAPAPSAARPRAPWMFAALVASNVFLVAMIVVLLVVRPSASGRVALPAGGAASTSSADAVLERLEAQRRDVEATLGEIDSMRATVVDLTSRLKRCEQATHDVTISRTPHPTPSPPAPVPTVPAPVAVPAETCDEVSCVLGNYTGACCAKFKRTEPVSDPNAPEGLDRKMISDAMLSVRSAVTACGDTHHGKGIVKIKVEVEPSGRTSHVTVTRSPDAALGGCIAGAVTRAKFPATQSGGSFSYPFVF